MPTTPMSQQARTLEFLAALTDRERWPRDRLLALRRERLRKMIAYVVPRSPYYRAVLKATGNGPKRLQDFPILNKSIVMAEFDRIVTDPQINRALVETPCGKRPHGLAVREISCLPQWRLDRDPIVDDL